MQYDAIKKKHTLKTVMQISSPEVPYMHVCIHKDCEIKLHKCISTVCKCVRVRTHKVLAWTLSGQHFRVQPQVFGENSRKYVFCWKG